MMTESPQYLRYWGKTAKKTDSRHNSYHLLAYHCLDVAACGYLIVKNNIFNTRDILKECGISGTDAENWIVWLFASHDIGKYARGFQKYALFPDS
ncbi:TPA: HD domain-containing protein, partial [Raoultella ornithinolytica]